jgi:glucose/arabinose dehydrogenase
MTKLKLLVVLIFAAGTVALLLTDNAANPHARAYSAGPPAGYTHAPGELDCADCHTTPAQSTGTFTLNAPQHYTPGQTYDITVTHASTDQTRVRWGFELTALDGGDQKAGTLDPADDLTQVINSQGPFPTREYIEHTSKGTFSGQQNGATWTFKWTAPDEDVGGVTFYVAGNQANGDGNSSGDNIYFTSASSAFQPPTPDFQLTVTPSTRTFAQGGGTTYNVTVTPLNGFTGQVTLGVTGLPPNTFSSFQPATVTLTNNSSPQTSVLSITGSANTPTGTSTLDITGTSGSLSHTVHATMNVVSAGDADIAVTQTVSPNPAQAGVDLKFTYTVTNNGPATADATVLKVTLPSNIGQTFSKGEGTCTLVVLQSGFEYDCTLDTINAGQSKSIDFTIRPDAPGTLNTSATANASEHDPFPSNNTVNAAIPVAAVSNTPLMTVSNLGVRTVVSGLNQPTSLAFIGTNDFLVLEKATGRVVRVKNGVMQPHAVADLAVNNASERGLLGIALHPNFAANGFVYLYWTESTRNTDTSAIDEVSTLGNRVDRFIWDGSDLTFDRTLIRLRALQTDDGQPSRGNHNGGVLRFGPDGKLYLIIGDNGRRGLLQNLPCGPTTNCPGPTIVDDQFGGPEPDDAHLTGVILRLNDDGTTPSDNPFFNANTGLTGAPADNVKKVFAYGVRNGFGMDFDPLGGSLWTQENGDDAFDEINRVEAGFNGGWIQMMGPSSRISEFKSIEVARGNSLQQNRWPPSNIADTPAQALARLYSLPGSHYTEPEFSWKYAIAPSPIGFARGTALGTQYAGDLFVGASRTTLLGGYLMRFKLSADRKSLATTDARLNDKVADNADKFDLAESESLVVGRDFGITTDIQTAPTSGSLYVVSLSNGAVYEVFAKPTLFVANLDGSQETPPHSVNGRGTATILLDKDETTARVSLHFHGLSATQTAAHIHTPAAPGQTAPPVFDLPLGNFDDYTITLTPQQASDLKAGLFYVNVHSTAFPAGEIRGQFGIVTQSSLVQFDVAEQDIPEASGVKTINVRRFGDTSTAVTVDYSTADGIASERSDYTTARGTLRFAPGETQKSFDILITDDGLSEPVEGFTVNLSNPTGPATLNNPSSVALAIIDNDSPPPSTNPIDDSQFFVRQHYHDFLHREPDAPGLAFWTNEIESCGTNAQCREVKRINVSAAFFLSIEFQRTGLPAYLANKAAFGNVSNDPPMPVLYAQFEHDVQSLQKGYVFGQPGAEAQLEANLRAYFDELVTRPAFVNRYANSTNTNFVGALLANASLNTTVGDIQVARLDGAQQVPPTGSPATGLIVVRRHPSGSDPTVTISLSLNNLSSPVTAVHIHGPAASGATAPALITLPTGEFTDFRVTLTSAQLNNLVRGLLYVDVHTQNNPDGEIRAQIPSQRFRIDALVNGLDAGVLTHAQVLRIVSELPEFKDAEFRRAFVLMEYFGYLRRDPDAAGYNFWLNKLNAFNGDYIRAEMVKAFINSDEYRHRFGQ